MMLKIRLRACFLPQWVRSGNLRMDAQYLQKWFELKGNKPGTNNRISIFLIIIIKVFMKYKQSIRPTIARHTYK